MLWALLNPGIQNKILSKQYVILPIQPPAFPTPSKWQEYISSFVCRWCYSPVLCLGGDAKTIKGLRCLLCQGTSPNKWPKFWFLEKGERITDSSCIGNSSNRPTHKYLGVTFKSSGTWSGHLESVALWAGASSNAIYCFSSGPGRKVVALLIQLYKNNKNSPFT